MGPPGTLPKSRPGVATSPTKQDLIDAARVIVNHFHIAFGINKITRLVLTFQAKAPRADKIFFFQYLAAEVQLSAEQQQAALCHPDIARVISYRDKTGEDACNNVLREQRRQRLRPAGRAGPPGDGTRPPGSPRGLATINTAASHRQGTEGLFQSSGIGRQQRYSAAEVSA